MFILTKMRSVVRLEPNSFQRDLPEALSEVLTEKLANKVVKDVGLVVALWDLISMHLPFKPAKDLPPLVHEGTVDI